jgi:hypothetical protein
MSEQGIAHKKQLITPTTTVCTLGVAGTAGIIDMAAHFGPNGLLAGAILSVIAYRHGEDIINGVRDRIPPPILDAMSERFGRRQKVSEEQYANPKDERASEDEDAQTLDATIDVTPNTAAYYAWDAEDDGETAPVNGTLDSSLFIFSEVLAKGFVPSVNKIFVGRTLEGKDIFVAAEDLCHVALSGKTGGGKGSLMRLIMVQLCSIGAKVLLLNPHYMRWVRAKDGPKFDEDWTPFEGINPRTGKPYLEAPPIASADVEPIARCLRWSVETLLAKRKAEGREGGKLFAPYFIVIDEWPDIISENKKAAGYLGKLLRQGRKYGIFVIVASQDFQVKTLGLEDEGGSVRKCFLTCYYTGGDTTTAKELLYSEKPSSLPENKIGKGTVLLRCTGTKNEATLAKVPFVDNAAVYRLLGPSTFKGAKQTVLVEEPEAPLPQATMPVIPTPTPVAQQPAPSGGLTIEQILALFAAVPMSEAAMLKLIDRLPVVQDAADDEGDDARSHLRLVSSEAVEDDYHAQETERLPETQRTTGRFSKSLSPDLLRVYNAYEPGKSHRDIARELGDISHPTVGKIIQRLKDKGAIDPNGRKTLAG